MSDLFFAADTPKVVASTVMSYANKWSFTGGAGTFNAVSAALWRNYLAWNNNLFTPESFDSSLGSDGEVGEFVRANINKARTTGLQYISLITRQKLYWDAITDVNSSSLIQDTRLAKGIANAVTEKQCLQTKMYNAAEKTFVYGGSFVSAVFKTDKGYPYAYSENPTDTSQPQIQYSGDMDIRIHDVSDVVYDWSIEEWEQMPWCAVRSLANKYDLAAQFPAMAHVVLSMPSARSEKRLVPRFNMLSSFENPDVIYVWEFYLRPCPAVPKGRLVIYVSPDGILFDNDNLYETLPVEPLMFSKIQGTCIGYPSLSTMLPAQELLDGIVSTISTNIRAFGKQNITMPSDSDIDPVQICDGMNVIRFKPIPGVAGGGEPKVLNLLVIPPQLMEFSASMANSVDDLSGLSSTIRGAPPPGVTAGNAIATLTANASEFLSQASSEYSACVQKVMNHVINGYRRFATAEQTTNLVGATSIGYSKKWKGEDLNNVHLLKLRQTNGIMDSLSGRQQIADNLLNNGLCTAGQYIKIQSGAPVEAIFEEQFTEEMAIQAEVEAILEGKSIIPIITDNHPKIIKAYQNILYNPAVRTNGKITADVVQLMDTRIALERQFQQNIELYQMIRGQPSPMAPPPMPLPGKEPGAPDQSTPSAPSAPAKPAATL